MLIKTGNSEQLLNLTAELFFIFLLCVFPLYLTSDLYIYLTYDKTIFLYLGTAAAVLCFSVAFVITKQKLRNLLQLSVIDYAVLIYLYWTFISAAFSPYKGYLFMGLPERHDGIISQMVYVFTYFAISRYYKIKDRDLRLFAVSSFVISAISMLQFYNIAFVNWFPFDRYFDNSRYNQPYLYHDCYSMPFRTTLGNINIVASYACVAAVFCFVVYIFNKQPFKYLFLVSATLCTYMLFICDTESGIIAVAVSFIFIFFLILNNKEALSRLFISGATVLTVYISYAASYLIRVTGSMSKKTLYQYIFVAVVLLCAGILLHFVPFKIKSLLITRKQYIIITIGLLLLFIIGGFTSVEFLGRKPSSGMIYEIREIMHGRFHPNFGTNRIRIWSEALRIWPERPILGTGPDTFFFATGDDFKQWALEYEAVKYDKAHNEYLQILVCLGIPGLLGYLVLIGGTIVSALKRYYAKMICCPYYIGAACAVFTYAVQAFFNVNVPITAPLLWVFLAIANNKYMRKGVDGYE